METDAGMRVLEAAKKFELEAAKKLHNKDLMTTKNAVDNIMSNLSDIPTELIEDIKWLLVQVRHQVDLHDSRKLEQISS